MMKQQKNEYLEEVLQQKREVDEELRTKPAPNVLVAASASRSRIGAPATTSRAIDYRVTGFFMWKTVVVPPNVYAVQTRRGRGEAIHVGLGESFRFNPYTDAFLLIPAAVQTLIINANCRCRELQGVMVQAYVQWGIGDIGVAYKRLDFSDVADPMRIVNVQLREQAEATIKDKVATMGIDEILSDKQPIIEELTSRLRMVVEGDSEGSGLGLKIVTVQIKEAVVSSTTLWENLQKPFRAERENVARKAELRNRQEIETRERQVSRETALAELEIADELAQRRQAGERATFDREHAEAQRRHQLEQAAEQQRIAEQNATERARLSGELALRLAAVDDELLRITKEVEALVGRRPLDEAEAERARTAAALSIELESSQHTAAAARRDIDLAIARKQRVIDNDLSEAHVRARLIAQLPEIAERMPTPGELRTVSIGDEGQLSSLLGFVAGALGVIEKSEPS